MATSVIFTSIVHRGVVDPCTLEPAPSVADWEYITTGLEGAPTIIEVEALLKGAHKISGTYRGWTMWLYPNVRFHRSDPKSSGGNGYAGSPILGTKEKVTLHMDNQVYNAEVEFV